MSVLDRGVIPILQLRAGDIILDGTNTTTSRVIGFNHIDHQATAVFVTISTVSGHAITATEDHYIYTIDHLGRRHLTRAGAIREGDRVLVAAWGAAPAASVVVDVIRFDGTGIVNVATTSNELAVDGIVASVYTSCDMTEDEATLLSSLQGMASSTLSSALDQSFVVA